MSFKVPTPAKKAVDPAALAAFAAGAPAAGQVESQAGQGRAPAMDTPPAAPDFANLDNKRRRPAFSLRLTDREAAQLKHLAETTPHSAHEFCLQAIQKALAERFPDNA
jgi:hypothetical protein